MNNKNIKFDAKDVNMSMDNYNDTTVIIALGLIMLPTIIDSITNLILSVK